MLYPGENNIVGTPLTVTVLIDSTYELSSVVAEVAGRQVRLGYTPEIYIRPFLFKPGWTNVVDLAGLPLGQHTVEVRATDDFGNTASSSRTFTYDTPPEVQLHLPIADSVARPEIRVVASCTDEQATDCILRISGAGGGLWIQLAEGTNQFDGMVSMATFDGMHVTLRVDAVGSNNQVSVTTTTVFVESSIWFREEAVVPGLILDVQPDRLLYQPDGQGDLRIRDRATQLDTQVPNSGGVGYGVAFLSPRGILFAGRPDDPSRVHEWRDGAFVDTGTQGYAIPANSLFIRGSYALWANGAGIIRRDLTAGTTLLLSSVAQFGASLAPNGDVAISSGPEPAIERYRDGVWTLLIKEEQFHNMFPQTDGQWVVYLKQDPVVSPWYSIAAHDGTHEIILTPREARQLGVTWGQDYQANNGWIAFTRQTTAAPQVWTRAPNGTETKHTFFNDPVLSPRNRIEALSPTGEVLIQKAGSRLWARTQQPAEFISSGLGYSYWSNDHWLVAIGHTLFRIVAPWTAIALDQPTVDAQGLFRCRATSLAGQRVVLQMTPDFATWTAVATNVLTTGSGELIDRGSATSAPRFYRAVTP
jgi:hypothetical protein